MEFLRRITDGVLTRIGCSARFHTCPPVQTGQPTSRHQREMLDHLSVVQRVEQIEDYHQIKMSGRMKGEG